MAWVYILQSEKNGRFYVGSTNNLEQRFNAHCQGLVEFTRRLRPWKIVFSQEFENYKKAHQAECRLKKFKSRRILEQIVNDGFIKIVGP